MKEIINRGGEKISPREVDEALLADRAVKSAITFALPDEALGEDVAAAIVVNEGMEVERQEIRRHAGQTLTTFKVPRVIVFLERMPLGFIGKPQRIGLADVLAQAISQQTAAERRAMSDEPAGEIEVQVAGIWSEILGVKEVSPTNSFTELGGDLLLAAKLAMQIRKMFAVDVPMVEFYEAAMVREQAALIAE